VLGPGDWFCHVSSSTLFHVAGVRNGIGGQSIKTSCSSPEEMPASRWVVRLVICRRIRRKCSLEGDSQMIDWPENAEKVRHVAKSSNQVQLSKWWMKIILDFTGDRPGGSKIAANPKMNTRCLLRLLITTFFRWKYCDDERLKLYLKESYEWLCLKTLAW
jgi:hypothetical protein